MRLISCIFRSVNPLVFHEAVRERGWSRENFRAFILLYTTLSCFMLLNSVAVHYWFTCTVFLPIKRSRISKTENWLDSILADHYCWVVYDFSLLKIPERLGFLWILYSKGWFIFLNQQFWIEIEILALYNIRV